MHHRPPSSISSSSSSSTKEKSATTTTTAAAAAAIAQCGIQFFTDLIESPITLKSRNFQRDPASPASGFSFATTDRNKKKKKNSRTQNLKLSKNCLMVFKRHNTLKTFGTSTAEESS
jgi:hypothetical protein